MNSPNKSATEIVADFLFFHHFFKRLFSRTRVNDRFLVGWNHLPPRKETSFECQRIVSGLSHVSSGLAIRRAF